MSLCAALFPQLYLVCSMYSATNYKSGLADERPAMGPFLLGSFDRDCIVSLTGSLFMYYPLAVYFYIMPFIYNYA